MIYAACIVKKAWTEGARIRMRVSAMEGRNGFSTGGRIELRIEKALKIPRILKSIFCVATQPKAVKGSGSGMSNFIALNASPGNLNLTCGFNLDR